MAKSKAAQQATKRYQDKAYDSIHLLLPKGTKDRIKATGSTVNGFINRAVLQALDNAQATTTQPDE